MHSSKQVVYSEVGHDDGEEGESYVCVEISVRAKARNRCVVKGDAVDYHCNKRPHFLRVPTPVIPPRDVCPYGSDEYADGKQECSRVEYDAADGCESPRLFFS